MRTVVVGAGEIGQLVAQDRPASGIRLDLIGFVDAEPLESRAETRGVSKLGALGELQALVAEHQVDRVIVAFSNEPDTETMDVVRSLRDQDVIVDVVPRLFELIGPRASMHLLEGMPRASHRSTDTVIVRHEEGVRRRLRRGRARRDGAALRVCGAPDQAGLTGTGLLPQERLGLDMEPLRA